MTFWTQIDAQLDRITAEKPDTFDGVKSILDTHDNVDNTRHNPDAVFFAGSGGERDLYTALWAAGWRTTWSMASYHYGMHHRATGETLTYCEGDVLRGDAR